MPCDAPSTVEPIGLQRGGVTHATDWHQKPYSAPILKVPQFFSRLICDEIQFTFM